MIKKHYNNLNPLKLTNDLTAQGIVPLNVANDLQDGQIIADNVEVWYTDDTDMDLVQSIIDVHDPTPIPPPPTQDDFLIDLELRMTMLELGITI